MNARELAEALDDGAEHALSADWAALLTEAARALRELDRDLKMAKAVMVGDERERYGKLRDAEALAGAVDNALMFAHEDYCGAPSIRDTGAIEGLRAALAAFRRGAGGV